MQLTYVFFIDIAISYVLSWIATSLGDTKNRNLSRSKNVTAEVFVFLVFVSIFIMAAFRHIEGLSVDEYAYRNRITTYDEMSFGKLLTSKIEWIAAIPTWVLSNITHNTQWIIIWSSLVTYAVFVFCIKKYCDNFEFGILLLFLLNIVNLSFNVIQQVEATAILMIGIPYVYKRKFWKYAIVVILASMVHSSAILLILIYFIVHMKPWSAKFIAVAIAFSLAVLLFNSVAANIFSALGLYDNYIDILSSGGGVKAITIIVAFVPIIICFLFRKRLPNDDKQLNCCINAALIYAMIYLISSQQKYVARFAIFLLPWILVLYTKMITYLREDKLSVPIYYFLTLGYGATMIYYTRSLTYTFMT